MKLYFFISLFICSLLNSSSYDDLIHCNLIKKGDLVSLHLGCGESHKDHFIFQHFSNPKSIALKSTPHYWLKKSV